jgi:hypothetical protein
MYPSLKIPVLNSQSKVAKGISLCVTSLVIFVAIIYPLDFAFLITSTDEWWWGTAHSIIYIAMGVNLILQFFTSFIDETGSERQEINAIWMHYLKTSFFWDFLASFPYYLVVTPALLRQMTEDVSGSEEEVKQFIAAGLRLPLLLTIRRLYMHLRSLRKSSLVKCLLIVAVFFFSCHLAGCIFVASGLRSVKGNEHLSWLSISGFVHFETSDTAPKYRIVYTESMFGLYVNALYWAFTTLSTTGFGDIVPVDNISRLVAIVVITYSLYMNASIAGHVYTALLESDNDDDRILKVSFELDQWITKSDRDKEDPSVSFEAKDSILRYFTQLWKSDLMFDVNDSLSSFLPESRGLIAVQMYMEAIQKVPIIHDIDDIGFKEHLCAHIKYDFALPGDIISGLGINDDSFLIILSGNGAVLETSIENVAMRLFSNDTINTHILLDLEPPKEFMLIIAETRTEYLFVNHDSVQELVNLFPRTFENARQRFSKSSNDGLARIQDNSSMAREMTVIVSEILSLEKSRHVPSSELDLIQRASEKMPSFCKKMALKTVEFAKTPSSVFESSMKNALRAMHDVYDGDSTTNNFTNLSEPVSLYVDLSKDVFAYSDSVQPEANSAFESVNRYGAASKKWRTVVRNFMNASRFAGVTRCDFLQYY